MPDQGVSAMSAVGTGSWEDLRRTLKEFTLNTQQKLEKERSALLVRCTTAETKLAKMEAYVKSNLTVYQKEIVKLRTQLAQFEAPTKGPRS